MFSARCIQKINQEMHLEKKINSINRLIQYLTSGLELRVCNENLIFLFLNQNICCGYSKEPSQ